MTDTNQMTVIRRRFSLTEYHNELLKEVVEERYASDSEALRAAIQHHARYINDDGETAIESLQTEVEHIGEEIETIKEKIDQRDSTVLNVAEPASTGIEDKTQSEPNSEIAMRIVQELSQEGPLSTHEIAEKTGEDLMPVISAIDSLCDSDIIRTVSEDDDRYELYR